MIQLKQAYVIVKKDPVGFSSPGHEVLFVNDKNESTKVGMVVRFRREDVFEEIPEGLLLLEESIYGREVSDDHNQGAGSIDEKGA